MLGGCASAPSTKFPQLDPAEITREDQVEIEDLLTAEGASVLSKIEKIEPEKVESKKPGAAELIPETTASKDEGKFDDVYVPKAKGLALVQTSHAIRVQENRHEVKEWIHYFSTKDKERFARFFERGARYKELVASILKTEGVPPEIFYLGLIESGYVTHAKSHASAVGIWQFIQGTGRRYGLRVNRYVDERKDPVRATRAAARYLRDLYEQFQSWELAMAAYNAGEGRIAQAIRRGGTRDYWQLSHRGYLPAETKDYVPKFMAAVAIGQRPAYYGFKKSTEDEYPDLVGVEFPSFITVRSIAHLAKMKSEDITAINPHLTHGVIPPTPRSKYVLWVDEEQATRLKHVSRRIASVIYKAPASPREKIQYSRSHPKAKSRTVASHSSPRPAHTHKVSKAARNMARR